MDVHHLNHPFDGTYAITQPFAANRFKAEPLGYLYKDGTIGYDDTQGILGHCHNGIDYACPTGTSVKAPASGTVTFAGWDTTGFGNCVVIDHGFIHTLCGHLSAIGCHAGEKLTPGQVFARTGNTGNSIGPHLHWSCFLVPSNRRRYLAPAPYLDAPEQPSSPGSTSHPGEGFPVHFEHFSVTADKNGGAVRIFDRPTSHGRTLRQAKAGEKFACDAWTYGDAHLDRSLGKMDRRWYHIAAGGWVASSRVQGNAPGSTP